jgi:hypothetical protein
MTLVGGVPLAYQELGKVQIREAEPLERGITPSVARFQLGYRPQSLERQRAMDTRMRVDDSYSTSTVTTARIRVSRRWRRRPNGRSACQ